MLKNFRKPHGILLVLIVLFTLAWALWTFIWVPASETPSMPTEPTQSVPVLE